MKHRKTILIDLDGVLNTYTGNYNENFIPSIKEGAKEFLEKLSQNYDVKIFTTRNNSLARKWVSENKLDKYVSDVTSFKSPAYLMIDDRCLNFRGDYYKTFSEIENFNVWYRQ